MHITRDFTLFLSIGCFVVISDPTRMISMCLNTLACKPRPSRRPRKIRKPLDTLKMHKSKKLALIRPNIHSIRSNGSMHTQGKASNLLEWSSLATFGRMTSHSVEWIISSKILASKWMEMTNEAPFSRMKPPFGRMGVCFCKNYFFASFTSRAILELSSSFVFRL